MLALSPSSRRFSIRWQLILGVALMNAVLMSLFVADLVMRQRAFLHEEQMQRSVGLIQGIARQVTVGLLAGDLAAVQEVVDGFREYPELHYAFVTDPAGRVMAHSDRQRIGSYLADERSFDMLRGAKTLRTLVDDERSIDLAMPVISDGRLIGWTRFASGRKASESSLQAVASKGTIYALAAIALGSALAYWLGSVMMRKLNELLKVAERIRAGQRDLRVSTGSDSEMGRLGAVFNGMIDALVDRERTLQETNAALEARVAARTAELEVQALADSLTGLPNRRSLLQNLPVAMRRADRSDRALALLFLDLDGFKGVNDQYGHEAGDKVLAEFARRLLASVREVDTVARLAGDEFVVIVETLNSPADDVRKVAAKIVAAAQQPFALGGGQSITLSASIGVSVYAPPDSAGPDDLLSRADEAMYSSKHDGKGRFTLWNPDTPALRPSSMTESTQELQRD